MSQRTWDESSEEVGISYPTNSAQIRFAAGELVSAFDEQATIYNLSTGPGSEKVTVTIVTDRDYLEEHELANDSDVVNTNLGQEGFQILPGQTQQSHNILVLADDESGAIYGTLTEHIDRKDSLDAIEKQCVTPRFSERAVKFNLP